MKQTIMKPQNVIAHFQMIVNEGGVHSLLIAYARPEDSGLYRCEAKNRAGQAKFTVGLTVEGKTPTVRIIWI